MVNLIMPVIGVWKMHPYLFGFICASVWFFIWVGWLMYVTDIKGEDRGIVYNNAGCFVGYIVMMIMIYIYAYL